MRRSFSTAPALWAGDTMTNGWPDFCQEPSGAAPPLPSPPPPPAPVWTPVVVVACVPVELVVACVPVELLGPCAPDPLIPIEPPTPGPVPSGLNSRDVGLQAAMTATAPHVEAKIVRA